MLPTVLMLRMLPTVLMLMLRMCPSILLDGGHSSSGTEAGGCELGGISCWDMSSLPVQQAMEQKVASALHPRPSPATVVRVFAPGTVQRQHCGLEPAARQ